MPLPAEQKIALYLLPNKILIEPLYGSSPVWSSSGREIVLDTSVLPQELGDDLATQLAISGPIRQLPGQVVANRKGLIKHAGCNTQKAFYQQAKRVTVFSDGEQFVIEAFSTHVAERAFYRIPPESLAIARKASFDNVALANLVQEKWRTCLIQ